MKKSCVWHEESEKIECKSDFIRDHYQTSCLLNFDDKKEGIFFVLLFVMHDDVFGKKSD